MTRILGKRLAAMLLLVPLAACQGVRTTQGGVVGVDRQQRMIVSNDAVVQSAQQEYAQLMSTAQNEGKLNPVAAQTNRVRSIATRLIAQTPAFRADAKSWNWEINVLKSPEVNAWCMPGGKIAVYTGMIDKLKPSDDELAAVMGHEIAHALREHARERASEQAVAGLGIQILSTVTGVGNVGQKGMEYAYMGLLGLPNSRSHETEADRIGVELAARAGFDPRAAVTLWNKMGNLGDSEPPKFLSTHPSRADRQSDLTVYSARVLPLYEQARATR